MVGPGRVELPTSRLSGVRSYQLSYRPNRKNPLILRKIKGIWYNIESEPCKYPVFSLAWVMVYSLYPSPIGLRKKLKRNFSCPDGSNDNVLSQELFFFLRNLTVSAFYFWGEGYLFSGRTSCSIILGATRGGKFSQTKRRLVYLARFVQDLVRKELPPEGQ